MTLSVVCLTTVDIIIVSKGDLKKPEKYQVVKPCHLHVNLNRGLDSLRENNQGTLSLH